MRFPSKSIVEKLIEYINFESTNKFTLIINNASRPNTSHSSHRKSSIKIQEEITTFQTTVERKSARSFSQLSITADLNNTNNPDQFNTNSNNDEIIDQVINKVVLDVPYRFLNRCFTNHTFLKFTFKYIILAIY